MTSATERQNLAEAGVADGWGHRTSDGRGDIFSKATTSIRTIWAGDELSGATLFHDGFYESHTRAPATVQAWFKR